MSSEFVPRESSTEGSHAPEEAAIRRLVGRWVWARQYGTQSQLRQTEEALLRWYGGEPLAPATYKRAFLEAMNQDDDQS